MTQWINSSWLLTSFSCLLISASRFLAEAIATHFVHRCLLLAQHLQRADLLKGILLADLAEREADVDQNPISGPWILIRQERQIHFAAHTTNIHQGERKVRKQLQNLTGYG